MYYREKTLIYTYLVEMDVADTKRVEIHVVVRY